MSFDNTETWKADPVIVARCRDSFYEFLKHFWSVVSPDPFSDNWHISYLCSELQQVAFRIFNRQPKEYDLIINIPPGTSKSTICTVMFPAWCWIHSPGMRFITGSYSRELSIFHAQRSRDVIMSDFYRQAFQVFIRRDRNQKFEYENKRLGVRTAVSTGSTLTGKHAHCIIIDDPLNAAQSASKAELTRANTWVDRSVSTRKADKAVTPLILIMQRLHTDDCTGYLLGKKDKAIKHICLPAEYDARAVSPPELGSFYKDGLLDPRRLSRNVLTAARADLGSFGFEGQFQQHPAPVEGGFIKREWFKREHLKRLPLDQVTWNFVVDTAFTTDTRNDPSAILAYTYYQETWYFRNLEIVRLLYPDLCAFIARFVQENGYNYSSRIYIEPKANGKSIVQSLRADTELNVIEHFNPVKDKLSRLQQVSAKIERGSVKLIVNPDGKDPQWLTNYLDQITAFPNTRHDEEADLTVMALNNHLNKPSLKVWVI